MCHRKDMFGEGFDIFSEIQVTRTLSGASLMLRDHRSFLASEELTLLLVVSMGS